MKKDEHKLASNEEPAADKTSTPAVEFKELSLDLIDDPEAPMRNDLTPASVEELVISIKQVGIIEPIVVKPKGGRYEVIAGHRRTYASRLAKLATVPCHVRTADSQETEMLKIHENLYRQDISPAEEAKHFAYLIDKQKLTPTRISQLISKSLSYVTDRLAILEYPDFLLEAMQTKQISFSVAREFAQFDDLKQMSTAVYYAKRGGMTQEMARKWVQDYKRSKETSSATQPIPVQPAGENQIVEHMVDCIYCWQQVKLYEASIAYTHDRCMNEIVKLRNETIEQPQTT